MVVILCFVAFNLNGTFYGAENNHPAGLFI